MRKLPIGIQSFEKLRKDDYIYVDKTKFIWNIIHDGTVYFLSRPRRFGKSLFLSTLEAYFEGKKEIFSGLEIERLMAENNEPWTEYPIIKMSFAAGDFTREAELQEKIDGILNGYAEKFDISFSSITNGDKFCELIEQINIKTGKSVVVLIDEYDKPLLDGLAVDDDIVEKNRKTLKGFYGALKDSDKFLKFVFITGVTKFSKVSLFSDLNQLNDISLDTKYAGVCGITENELEGIFPSEIETLAKEYEISKEDCISELKKNYDGYHFSSEKTGVYNPFSILNCFSKKDFDRYWFATGTPTFLINLLEKSGRPMEDLSNGVSASKDRMDNYRADSNDFIPLFYQTGYLTITGFDRRFRTYKLAFPNDEVKYGFLEAVIPLASPKYDAPEGAFNAGKMIEYLDTNELEPMMEMLRALLASIPYHEGKAPEDEQQWRNILYAIFAVLGQYVRAEIHSSRGRSDFVIENENYVYIFEFKQDKTPEEALEQIDAQGYTTPYISSGKQIVKIGASFSSDERTVSDWKIV